MKLARKLPLQAAYPSQIKQKLARAHTELQQQDYLASVTYAVTPQGEDKVTYTFVAPPALDRSAPAAPTLTAGAFTGYTFYARVGVVRNTGGNFVKFWQSDRDVFTAPAVLFTDHAGQVAYAVLAGADLTAFQVAVPPIARLARGSFGVTTSSNHGISLAGNANGVGAQNIVSNGVGATLDGFQGSATFSVPLISSQNFYWKTDATSAVFQITISGYLI